ncbi:MAG: hypothetical protein AABW80_00385 [Nanoarchaeota archaeon]
MYFHDLSTFKNPKELQEYLEYQEKFLFECLRGQNKALKPGDMKIFIPKLARYWKYYANMSVTNARNQAFGTVHCAALLNFSRSHKYSCDYHETIKDPQRVKVNALEQELEKTAPTTDDMRLVRDLRI